METTTHTYQAGEYSPRAGRRVCAICGETQGSKFHSVAAPTADDVTEWFTSYDAKLARRSDR